MKAERNSRLSNSETHECLPWRPMIKTLTRAIFCLYLCTAQAIVQTGQSAKPPEQSDDVIKIDIDLVQIDALECYECGSGAAWAFRSIQAFGELSKFSNEVFPGKTHNPNNKSESRSLQKVRVCGILLANLCLT